MRITRLPMCAVALVALVGLTAAPTAADDMSRDVGYPAAQRSELEAQAVANDLSPDEARSVQAQIDEVVADTGGTQVAINQVRWDGGDTLVPLPGEAQARELGVAPTAAAAHGCDRDQFCLYENPNYTGIVARMSSCTWHDVGGKYFESYVNGLRPAGTRAHFYRSDLTQVTATKPSFDKGTIPLDVYIATFYVRPC
jgi:hypothetical protein